MALVKPFTAVRYQGERVDLGRVLARDPTSLEDAAARALTAAEPRNVVRFCLPREEPGDGRAGGVRRARFLYAEQRRAGLLVRDERPAFYCLRRRDEDGEIVQGFFAAAAIEDLERASGGGGDGDDDDGGADGYEDGDERLVPLARALSLLAVPAIATYVDERRRIGRCFEAEIERAADASFTFEGTEHELWIVDDESTTARVSALLAGQAPKLVAGGAAWSAAVRLAAEAPAPRADEDGGPPCGLVFLVEARAARVPSALLAPTGLAMLPLRRAA